MHRWGQWGHYDGTCTPTNCRYLVTLEDISAKLYEIPVLEKVREKLPRDAFRRVYSLLGGKSATFQASFIVQDGNIWRTTAELMLQIDPSPFVQDDSVYELVYTAQSRQSLNGEPHEGHSILGNDEQVSDHPDYKVGRPGACEGCIAATATYTLQSTPDEIRRLTNIQFSCLTPVRRCRTIADVNPEASEWDLQNSPWGPVSGAAEHPAAPVPCRIPLWAIARDAMAVMAVDALANQTLGNSEYAHDAVRLRLVDTLKGDPGRPNGSLIWAFPHTGDRVRPEFPKAPEPISPGQRYLLATKYPMQDLVTPPFTPSNPDRPIFDAARCSLFPDTPQNRADLQKGFAMNDSLRVPEF